MASVPPVRRLRRDEAYHPFFMLYARLRLELAHPEQHQPETLEKVRQKMARLITHCTEVASRMYQIPASEFLPRMMEAAETSDFTAPTEEDTLREYMPDLEDLLDIDDSAFAESMD